MGSWGVPLCLFAAGAGCGRRGGGGRGEAHLPQGALPGTRVQAGSSLEGEVVLWKDRCERKRRTAESQRQQALQKQERRSLQDRCYNSSPSRPRITLSGLLGRTHRHHAPVA